MNMGNENGDHPGGTSRLDGGTPPVERPLTGIALVLLSSSAIAVVPTAAKLAFESGSHPLTVLALRSVIGVALMALLIVVSGQTFSMSRRAFVLCLYVGLAHTIAAYGFIGSVAHMPVSLAVLVYSTHPVLLAVFSHWQGDEHLPAWKLMLALVILAALGLTLNAGLDRLTATGIALGTLASVSVCGTILLCTRAQREATSMQLNFYMMAMALVSFATATTVDNSWSLPSGALGWLGLVGAGLGVTVGMLAFVAALRFVSMVRATIVSNIEPLLGILFAAAVLGEGLNAVQWMGVALIVTALVLFELPSGRKPPVGGPTSVVQLS